MAINPFTLVVASVLLASVAQVLFKIGMSDPHVQSALASSDLLVKISTVAFNVPVLTGLLLYAASIALWLLALTRIDLSLAYPFVGLGIVMTVLIAALMLKEPFSLMRMAGTLFVAGGVFLVSRG